MFCTQNKLQLDAALVYLAKRGAQPLEPEALSEAAGVGVVVRSTSDCRGARDRKAPRAPCVGSCGALGCEGVPKDMPEALKEDTHVGVMARKYF